MKSKFIILFFILSYNCFSQGFKWSGKLDTIPVYILCNRIDTIGNLTKSWVTTCKKGFEVVEIHSNLEGNIDPYIHQFREQKYNVH